MAQLSRTLNRLNALGRQMRSMDRRKVEAAQRDARGLFQGLCETYLEADADTRIDIDITFDSYEGLINTLISYLNTTAEEARKTAARKPDAAKLLIRRAAAADAIINERGNQTRLKEAQVKLREAAKTVKYDLAKLVSSLMIDPKRYAQRAMALYKSGQRADGCRAMGRALTLQPALASNDQIQRLAGALTGEAPSGAVVTLADAFLRAKLVDELLGQLPEKTLEATQTRSGTAKGASKGGMNGWAIGLVVLLILTVVAIFASGLAGPLLSGLGQ